ARAAGLAPAQAIRRSAQTLTQFVRENPQPFTFVARARSTSNNSMRHAIRAEIRLFTSELATDLARFPVLREWSTEDLQMVAGLLVGAMISTVEAILDTPHDDLLAQAEITRTAEKQIR